MALFGYHQILICEEQREELGTTIWTHWFSLRPGNGNVPGCPVRVGLIGAERTLFDAALVGVGVQKALRLGLIVTSAMDEYS